MEERTTLLVRRLNRISTFTYVLQTHISNLFETNHTKINALVNINRDKFEKKMQFNRPYFVNETIYIYDNNKNDYNIITSL